MFRSRNVSVALLLFHDMRFIRYALACRLWYSRDSLAEMGASLCQFNILRYFTHIIGRYYPLVSYVCLSYCVSYIPAV